MDKSFSANDNKFMTRALELAELGVGHVNPNPMVGAVIVKNGNIIGEGYHEFFGGPHAEVNAIKNCSESPVGSTIYVTLEPCSHFGKTPPCSLALIENKFSRVVIAMTDPNPLVSGRGIKMMEDQGIQVESGLMEDQAKILNKFFIKNITQKLPYVIMKTAMSLDGKIATHTGDSKWISGEESRKYVHKMRHNMKGIMVAINTVLTDDPSLNCRLDIENPNQPIRIIVDSRLRIQDTAKVLNTKEQQTIIATTSKADKSKIIKIQESGAEVIIVEEIDGKVNLNQLMMHLNEKGIDSILLEGGGTLNFSALKSGIVDEVVSFIAPKIIGGANAISPVEGMGFDKINSCTEIESIELEKSGDDILVHGKIKK